MLRRLAWLLAATSLAGACSLSAGFDGLTSGDTDDGGGLDAAGDAGAPKICAPGTDLTTDPASCGSCGHDCLGGLCTAGQCQPVIIASGVQAFHVRVDASYAYLPDAAGGRLVRVPKRGGVMDTLVSGEGDLGELTIDDTWVYYTSTPGIRRVMKTGGAPEDVVTTASLGFIVTDADSLYWCDFEKTATGKLHRVNKDGTNDVVLFGNLATSEAIALSGDDVFFGESGLGGAPGALQRVKRDGSGAVVLSSIGARRIVVDDTNVYWLSYGSPDVYSVARTGGPVTTVATSSGPTQAADLAIDATSIYWAVNEDDGGAVLHVDKQGGAVDSVAGPLPSPAGVALDDVAVYWTVPSASAVYMRAK